MRNSPGTKAFFSFDCASYTSSRPPAFHNSPVMILSFVLYSLFLRGNGILARPPPLLPSTSELSFYPCEIDYRAFTQRSEWAIFWSCLATLVACSWGVVHPNIPAPSDRFLRLFGRRLMIMGYMLVVPDMVMVWAGRQWYAAHEIAERHKDRGWTTTHGFFASMGGFMLYEDGVMTRTLVIEDLEQLASEGKIDWPTITEKDIRKMSKGDFISKSVAVFQTTWFITQCIARCAAGLNFTELELVTFVFTVLNGISYWLWWNKPLDVSCPVPVYIRKTELHTVDSGAGDTPDDKDLGHKDDAEMETKPSVESAMYMVFIILLVIVLFITAPLFDIWFPVVCMARCDFIFSDRPLSVPTFYAPATKNRTGLPVIGIGVAMLFGGIHFIAWCFGCLSAETQHVWRISAVTIAVITTYAAVDYLKPNNSAGQTPIRHLPFDLRPVEIIALLLCQLVYWVSRATLIIAPLFAMRSLPPKSLLDVEWTSYIPHI